jgi:ATP-dependent Lon protease
MRCEMGNISEMEKAMNLPLLPIKNSVLFPQLFLPLSVGRALSVSAAEESLKSEDSEIVIFAQRDPSTEKPGLDELYSIGCRARIRKIAKPRPDQLELIVQGIERVVLIRIEQTEPFLKARFHKLPLPGEKGPEVEALQRSILEMADKLISLSSRESAEQLDQVVGNVDQPLHLVYLLASLLGLNVEKSQALLEAATVQDALHLMHVYLSYELQVMELRSKIASDAQTEMGREQREYLLKQQLRAIQQELGEVSPEKAEVEGLRDRLKKTNLPDLVRKEAERELDRLDRIPSASPDRSVLQSYLELVLDLPWSVKVDEVLDIPRTRKILDEDHFDLTDVKERILEQLGVLKLNPNAKAPILCFVGPPGVGKTSLGKSIARAMGRPFERMSLGGMHDEAELRGHRRTYIGSMPGVIIRALRRAGANNPVLMLDEVDKLGRDFRGDPAAALLEILDPEQNHTFRDNYLDLPFDLSGVFFITTANTLDTIPGPLLDRMELIRLPGYSEEEKIEIARRYLIPRQVTHSGLGTEDCTIPDETLKRIISRHTREAGVRQLERSIGRLMRKVALKFAEGISEPVIVESGQLVDFLGNEQSIFEQGRKILPAGVSTGLAWTETGGDVLYVEAALLPKGRDLILTGQLGRVMQESAQAARSYIWSHADKIGIDPGLVQETGIHVHVPAGAVPKDGPSAGVTMLAALASVYSGIPVRNDTAMTGEVTLAGLVLPVGGIKEKVLAARRSGIRRIILPRENQKNLRDLPEHVRKEMEFVFVETVDEVIREIFHSEEMKRIPA